MPPRLRGLVADTGFWLAAFDRGDSQHDRAANLLEDLRESVILMPWPIMYEVLRTRTVKKPQLLEPFERVLAQRKVYRIDDVPYREACLEETFTGAREGRPISLVDMVVRAVLADSTFRITRLLTFNRGDFLDICEARRIHVWPDSAG